jgi:hypothetical protein
VAISAIKIMQRNLAAQPRACASRISVASGRKFRIEPHGLGCRTGWRMRRLVSRPCNRRRVGALDFGRQDGARVFGRQIGGLDFR